MNVPMNPSVLLAGFGLAITSLIGYNFVHKPQQRQLGLVRTAIVAEQAKQQTLSAIASSLRQMEQYRARLPEEPDPSWLVRHVLSVAEQSGVELTSISQEPLQRFEQYTRLAVRLQVTASYHHLGTFLGRLEQSPVFVRVDDLDVSQSRTSSNRSPAPDISLTLSTFYVPPSTAIVGGGVTP